MNQVLQFDLLDLLTQTANNNQFQPIIVAANNQLAPIIGCYRLLLLANRPIRIIGKTADNRPLTIVIDYTVHLLLPVNHTQQFQLAEG